MRTNRPQLTPAELEAAQAELEARNRREKEREREAKDRAAMLLREYLDDRQRDTLDKHRWFEVISPKGRVFRIKHGRAGNVFLVEGGHEAVRYCIHPVDFIPEEDTMLSQALMIQAQEDDFESVANKTRLRAAA